MQHEKVNILLVDDQPAKLLSYEAVLKDLNENLIRASSAADALRVLLKTEIAVVLIDVCMPDLDGFELASMIREHPRYHRTAIIFVSAIHLNESDYLRGYEIGGFDYVPVPVVPELLRAKVKVFAELYRKTRQLEELNEQLEARVAERTAEVEASSDRLRQSERARSLALAAGQMGSWEWDLRTDECITDAGLRGIFGIEESSPAQPLESLKKLIRSEDFVRLEQLVRQSRSAFQAEIQVVRPSGEVRTCFCVGAPVVGPTDEAARLVSIVAIDLTERRRAEERQLLLAREVDHRARNALALVQAIIRLTRAANKEDYIKAVEGRVQSLALAHTLLSESRWQGADVKRLAEEELAPYRTAEGARVRIDGPPVFLGPETAQSLALVLHELATNSAKYGALSAGEGIVGFRWNIEGRQLALAWEETGGPPVRPPSSHGFGTRIMNSSIKRQIGGDVQWQWPATGLRCLLHVPLADDAPAHASDPDGSVRSPGESGKRVLLVEDEALIGMMMRDLLSEAGVSVLGPVATVRDALAAVSEPLDAAFLDINVGREPVYPVAAALAERGIPFAFLTGYGREALDGSFADAPVLQKPVTRESLLGQLTDMLDVSSGEGQVAPPRMTSLRIA